MAVGADELRALHRLVTERRGVHEAIALAEVGVVATWSWWWVCSPLWIPALIALALGLLVLVGYGCAACIRAIGDWRTRRDRMRRLMED